MRQGPEEKTILQDVPWPDEPLVMEPGQTFGSVTDTIADAVLTRPIGLGWLFGLVVGMTLLGVLMAASRVAYTALKWAGAAYLAWLGINLIAKPRSRFDLAAPAAPRGGNWWLRGFLTNLLNPKVGVFYVSFLPQLVPAHVPTAPFVFLLAALHSGLGLAWFALLIAGVAPLKRWLGRASVVRWLDRATGAVFLAFGARLALERR